MRPALLVLALAPLFLNGLLLIPVQSNFYAVLAIDYLSRLVALIPIYFALRFRLLNLKSLGLIWPGWQSFWMGTLLLTIVSVALNRSMTWHFDDQLSILRLFQFPAYPSEQSRFFDLTLGLLFVAITEEVVFRGVLLSWLRTTQLPRSIIFVPVSICFGLIHWESGVVAMGIAAVWSILPTLYVQRYQSLYPVIIAHYLTDLVAFF